MKIVILVDYSHHEFNKDFELSNVLISKGHSVFLAVNSNQFEYLNINCDKSYRGYSYVDHLNYKNIPIIPENLI